MADDQTEDSFMPFGKYRGYRLSYVIANDPAYLLWAHETVDSFNLSPLTLQRVERAAEDRPR